MSTFYLVRHGLRISRDEDTLLSEPGIKQAELTGKYLKSKNIQHIFVSPAKRTLHTAEIINRSLQIVQSVDKRLKERMEYEPGFGNFETFLEEWDKTMASCEYQPPYGNSAISAGNRIANLFDELEEDGNYLFISHGGVIGDVIRNLFPELQLTLTADPVKNLRWLHIAECSISEFATVTIVLTVLKHVNDCQINFPQSS